jgi:hypothetical protein
MSLRQAKHTVRLNIQRVNPNETDDKTFSIEVELPSYMTKIKGLAISSNIRKDLVFYRGSSVNLRISGTEIISDGEPANEYMFGIDSHSKTWNFGELPVEGTNRRLFFRYIDSPVTGFDFPSGGYQVLVILTYERKD